MHNFTHWFVPKNGRSKIGPFQIGNSNVRILNIKVRYDRRLQRDEVSCITDAYSFNDDNDDLMRIHIDIYGILDEIMTLRY